MGRDIVDPPLGLGETEGLGTWLGAGVGLADAWLPIEEFTGLGPGLGLGVGLGLGALACDTLALDETLGAGLGAGAGGGLLGAALGGGLGGALLDEECCVKPVEENSRMAATTRLESRIKHLLPTATDFSSHIIQTQPTI
ncbi:MAG: hypothetical protein LAO24_18235 [Acidobacteriia bacterium]|nr:hypothetical protein [Terriglobia bacterium]